MRLAFGEQLGVYPVSVEVFLDGYSGPRRHIHQFLWKSGWLRVSEVEVCTSLATWRKQLVACITDHGDVIPAGIAARLFEMPASAPREVEHTPPDELDEVMDALYWDFIGRCDRMALNQLDEVSRRADANIRALEYRYERVAQTASDKIRDIRRRVRMPDASIDREAAKISIGRLSSMAAKIPAALRQRIAEARKEVEEMEDQVNASLGADGSLQEAFTLYWTTRPRWRGRRLYQVPAQEETYTAHSRPAETENPPPEQAHAPAAECGEQSAETRVMMRPETTETGDVPFDEAAFQKILQRDAARELAATRQSGLELANDED